MMLSQLASAVLTAFPQSRTLGAACHQDTQQPTREHAMEAKDKASSDEAGTIMQPKQTVRRRLYFEFSDALAMQWRWVSGVSGPLRVVWLG